MKYKRVLLKLSGEVLGGESSAVFDIDVMRAVCAEIKEAHGLGCQICLVVGGGNICRGAAITNIGIDRITGDQMGMLATVINALSLQNVLESLGVVTRVQTAIPMPTIGEPYIRRRAIRHMEKGRIVIFSAGTGHPFFSTDTAAVLRGIETGCDVVLKGCSVNGVYSADPKKNASVFKYDRVTYKDVLDNELGVMDNTAVSLAGNHNMPIIVFNIQKRGEVLKVLSHLGDFSIIHSNK